MLPDALLDLLFSPMQKMNRWLKELYTSLTTLAQKLVSTLLNNEFILNIDSELTPVETKNPQTFSAEKKT